MGSCFALAILYNKSLYNFVNFRKIALSNPPGPSQLNTNRSCYFPGYLELWQYLKIPILSSLIKHLFKTCLYPIACTLFSVKALTTT